MSLPADRIEPVRAPDYGRGRTRPVMTPNQPVPSASPARTAATRPRTSTTPPRRSRRARRGPHLAFLAFSGLIVFSLIVGVVALNALLAQSAFRAHALQAQLSGLSERNHVLTTQAAELSAPSRIARWARANNMDQPSAVVILQMVPGKAHKG